jgi:rare lipoprotein A
MMVRSGGAVCVAVAMFAFSSLSSTSIIKSGGIARGATTTRAWLLRAAAEQTKKNQNAALKGADVRIASAGAVNIGALIARAIGAGATITGTASTYNPFRAADIKAGGPETASGERYDPSAWTAAIQIDLRDKFGGVHFGKDYRPCFALVAKDDKQAIIKINDVGPLEPGRVIDFNEQTMRYFDPSLERGLISSVAITPLLGDGWLTGPLPEHPQRS